MSSLLSRIRPGSPVDYMLVFVPLAMILDYAGTSPVVVFVVSALAIVPLAGLLGRATERLAERAGPGVGGLLNATFGNAAELIIATIGLSKGLGEVVKASITGSILGNLLLVLGLSIFAGGLRHTEQRFNRSAASMGATLLALAAIAMIVPSLFWFSAGGSASTGPVALERGLSLEISIVLAVVYLLSLVFSLRTHKHLYSGEADLLAREDTKHSPIGGAIAMLIGSSVFIAILSELLVGAIEPAAEAVHLTDLFVGVIVVAIVGNAAEHASAVSAAMKNQMDLAVHIAIGSSLQIALFVTPLLVFLSYAIGPHPIDLHFTMFEVGAVTLSVLAVNLVCMDGESNWMEGVMLLAVYAILGLAFYFLPGV